MSGRYKYHQFLMHHSQLFLVRIHSTRSRCFLCNKLTNRTATYAGILLSIYS